MRLVFISDTHNYDFSNAPAGDMFVHCGDATRLGLIEEWEQFDAYWKKLPHKSKVFVPGNHDFNAPPQSNHTEWSGVNFPITMLPYVTGLPRWAFNITEERAEELSLIVGEGLVLAHSPPQGILDYVPPSPKHGPGGNYGVKAWNNIKAKVFVCGHIHEQAGKYVHKNGCDYYNVSLCDEWYMPRGSYLSLDYVDGNFINPIWTPYGP